MSQYRELDGLLKEVASNHGIILATIFAPAKTSKILKITIRPLLIKNQPMYQMSFQDKEQVKHKNIAESSFAKELHELFALGFKQAVLCTQQADFHLIMSKKGEMSIVKKNATKSAPGPLTHNRKKMHLLEEGAPIPFLVELGVMTQEGKVVPKKRDKFKQINRFVEMIADVVPYLDRTKTIHIVDFGCGKAYLTFALYHYLKNILNYPVEIVGLDLKQDVINKCQALANTLKFDHLRFEIGDINQHESNTDVHMVVSLHACDTATDAAIEKGVRWRSDVILAVPCCQHELFNQIKNETLSPLLSHGIMKEKLSSLVTDAARAQLLKVLGYQVQVIEFIDMEHTPKNILIRAFRQKTAKDPQADWSDYLSFKKMFNISPSLEKRFHEELYK